MTMTPVVLGSGGDWRGEEEEGESCADWVLNLNRFGEEERK